MKKTIFPILFLLLLLSFSSCKKVTHSDVSVNIAFNIGNETVDWDTLLYANAAGNQFSVNHLQFFISDLKLTDAGGNVFSWDIYQYVDYDDPSTFNFSLSDVPVGTYTSFTANIGLNATQNVDDGLPNVQELNAMAWPVPMGGGYHFMKMEGYYLDSAANPIGYAMHLGRSENLAFSTGTMSIEFEEETEGMTLTFDIMEWHQNPTNWDFNTDGTAIMADPTAQTKLSNNGATVLSVSK